MTKGFNLNLLFCLSAALVGVSCSSRVEARSAQSFTSGIAVGKDLLVAKKIAASGEANSSSLVLWDVGASKSVQTYAMPESHKDVLEIFPSAQADEVFLLVQIRMAGTDRPDLLRLNLKSGAISSVEKAIDCADLIRVAAVKNQLNFECGSETPFPPKKAKFSVSVKGLLSNDGVKIKKGLQVGEALIEQVKLDAVDEIAALGFKVGKSPVKQLNASDVAIAPPSSKK